jgi:eukaryotic-like serine/threonine-protein kinase
MAPEVAALPRRFGRYTLFDFVGKGGMAEIFLARAETELGGSRMCVVKEILPHLASDAKFADMLIFEAKLAARLSHANIVQVFDLGRTEDRLFIAMEYVEGYDLNALLRECTRRAVPLPLEFALEVIHSILRGLDYAHRREDDDGKLLGIVHRDVSPSNVLVSFSGEVKLCDFGIAHANTLVDKPAGSTQEAIQGKAGYMSPEHANGHAVDARSDVFAAGILLWELIAGRRMYKVAPGESLLDMARRAQIVDPPTRGFAGEETLALLLRKALAHDPLERFQSAQEMATALDTFCDETKIQRSAIRFGEWMRENLQRTKASASVTDVPEAKPVPSELPRDEGTVRLPVEEPKARKAPLVGAMIPSPGAMRTFKALSQAAPEPPTALIVTETPAAAVEASPRPTLSAAWIAAIVVVLCLAAYLLTR